MALTTFAQKCRWYRRALGRNPLIRGADRLEAVAVLIVFVLALVAVPVAAHTGSRIYDTRLQLATEQAQTRHSVEAEVVRGITGIPTDFNTPAYVQVQWREGAQTRTERVMSPATVKQGAHLTLWLDQSGQVVSAPLTAGDAKVSAVGTAWVVWFATVVVGSLAALGVRRGLDRSRDRAWERELLLLAHNDDGWANRHT